MMVDYDMGGRGRLQMGVFIKGGKLVGGQYSLCSQLLMLNG